MFLYIRGMNRLKFYKKLLVLLVGCLCISCVHKDKLYRGHNLDLSGNPIPYTTLNPPENITPAMTREAFPWSFPEFNDSSQVAKLRYPRMVWTDKKRLSYEKRVEWFHNAKYGIFSHFLSGGEWTYETWNSWVNSVDVEKFAEEAQEVGAGYVIITLGQNQIYSCAPNPIIEKNWGQYTSERDLPMDLYYALQKRGIPMMLYVATDNQYMMPQPDSLKNEKKYKKWVEVVEWYSKHYGDKCTGWWVDGLIDFIPGYSQMIHDALRAGNENAIIASGQYELSDFIHGHCLSDKKRQQEVVKPFYGRWDPDFGIQWHVFQYIGKTWGESSVDWEEEELLQYVSDVIRGGGVFTFDLGTFDEDCFYNLIKHPTGMREDGTRIGPYLLIYPEQKQLLLKVKDRLKDIEISEG